MPAWSPDDERYAIAECTSGRAVAEGLYSLIASRILVLNPGTNREHS